MCPLIADGGSNIPATLPKLWPPAPNRMVGSLLAGTDETPGEVFLWQGRSTRPIAGWLGGAMARGSADRYFQQDIKDTLKLVPEGIEGQVPYKGPSETSCISSPGAARGDGYVARETSRVPEKAQFVRITGAGLRESHVPTSPSRARARITPAGIVFRAKLTTTRPAKRGIVAYGAVRTGNSRSRCAAVSDKIHPNTIQKRS